MDTKSLAYPAHPAILEETRERGTCSGCGTTHQDAYRASSQGGARLRGTDVLPVVQPSLLHPGRAMVLLGEDGQPIDHPR